MIFDRLPPRITGFFDPLEPPRSLGTDAFKRACHLAAQMEGGSVEDIDLNLFGRSYYGATVRTRTDHVSVLANSVYRYLAFVQPRSFGVGLQEMMFVEPVSLAATFSAVSDFQPFDADWLESELNSDILTDLAPAELEQVKYWKPQRIGDVIFNDWD